MKATRLPCLAPARFCSSFSLTAAATAAAAATTPADVAHRPRPRQPCARGDFRSLTRHAAPPSTTGLAGGVSAGAHVSQSRRAASSRARGPGTAVNMADYSRWTKEALVRRVQELEQQAKQARETQQGSPDPSALSTLATAASDDTTTTTSPPQPPKPRPKKALDPSRYATRFIALKIAYLGGRYGGFEFQPSGPLPAIEEELWKALVKACLVTPVPGRRADEVDLAAFDYSKCGRTDRGVSAFGQVVALRVRSRRPLTDGDGDGDGAAPFPPDREIQYCKVLNRLLPPDIRVLAWCPTPPPGFSARFSCRERKYRYFFTHPAYLGAPSAPSAPSGPGKQPQQQQRAVPDGRLDLDAMRTAAHHFVGVHDFRNFCKLDPKKQISNYHRRIFAADIVPVAAPSQLEGSDGSRPALYAFDVRGSAFLWHQIRHMVAVLFLVGQGLEPPSVVPALLDVAACPGRPPYAMADETPLVLWDCLFGGRREPAATGDSDGDGDGDGADGADQANTADTAGTTDELHWITATDEAPDSRIFMDGLWRGWHTAKMQEVLARQLLDRTLAFVGAATPWTPPPLRAANKTHTYEGGPLPRLTGRYVPLLQRPALAPPEEINDKFARQQGFASSAAMREAGNWRAVIKARKAGEAGAVAAAATQEPAA